MKTKILILLVLTALIPAFIISAQDPNPCLEESIATPYFGENPIEAEWEKQEFGEEGLCIAHASQDINGVSSQAIAYHDGDWKNSAWYQSGYPDMQFSGAIDVIGEGIAFFFRNAQFDSSYMYLLDEWGKVVLHQSVDLGSEFTFGPDHITIGSEGSFTYQHIQGRWQFVPYLFDPVTPEDDCVDDYEEVGYPETTIYMDATETVAVDWTMIDCRAAYTQLYLEDDGNYDEGYYQVLAVYGEENEWRISELYSSTQGQLKFKALLKHEFETNQELLVVLAFETQGESPTGYYYAMDSLQYFVGSPMPFIPEAGTSTVTIDGANDNEACTIRSRSPDDIPRWKIVCTTEESD